MDTTFISAWIAIVASVGTAIWEVIWRGATTCDTFEEIRQFAGEFGFDSENKESRKWWIKQTVRILERVCGWKKAEFLAAREAERCGKFEDAMRDFQSTRQQ